MPCQVSWSQDVRSGVKEAGSQETRESGSLKLGSWKVRCQGNKNSFLTKYYIFHCCKIPAESAKPRNGEGIFAQYINEELSAQ